MKKIIISLGIVLFVFISFCSCNGENYITEKKSTFKIISRYSSEDIVEIVNSWEGNLNHSTRSDGAVTLSENEAEIILSPLIDDGKIIQSSMLKQIDMENPTKDDIEIRNEIANFSNEELATLSFLIAITSEKKDVENADPRMKATDIIQELRPCLVSAIGLVNLKNIFKTIFVSGGVTSGEIITLVKVIGKRYVGYASLAFFIWDTIDCLHGRGVL